MSVIVTVISKRDGIVASDGRLFSSARFDHGKVTDPVKIESDTFDKTFVLANGKVIGAFAGLTHFGNKSISEHVAEIADPLLAGKHDLESLTTEIETHIKGRLAELDDEEVIFPCRRLNIILVAGAKFTRSKIQIMAVRLYPHKGQIGF